MNDSASHQARLILITAIALVFCRAELSAQCAPTPVEKPVAVKVLTIGKASRGIFGRKLKPMAASYDRIPYQLYIINYGSDAEIKRREKWITESPDFARCPYDCARITLVRVGPGDGPKSVFWKIPSGADNPAP